MSAQAAALEAAHRAAVQVLHRRRFDAVRALAERPARRRSHLGFSSTVQAELRNGTAAGWRPSASASPRMKLLEDSTSRNVRRSADQIHELAEGGYIERAEPIILIVTADRQNPSTYWVRWRPAGRAPSGSLRPLR